MEAQRGEGEEGQAAGLGDRWVVRFGKEGIPSYWGETESVHKRTDTVIASVLKAVPAAYLTEVRTDGSDLDKIVFEVEFDNRQEARIFAERLIHGDGPESRVTFVHRFFLDSYLQGIAERAVRAELARRRDYQTRREPER
jgi:hypothetical protein